VGVEKIESDSVLRFPALKSNKYEIMRLAAFRMMPPLLKALFHIILYFFYSSERQDSSLRLQEGPRDEFPELDFASFHVSLRHLLHGGMESGGRKIADIPGNQRSYI